MKKIVVVVVGAIVIPWALAYAQHDHASHHQMTQAPVDEQKHGGGAEVSGEAIDVGNTICPVTGEKIDEKTKATYEYEGKIYHFCCAACIEEFKKNPQEYIKKIKDAK